jgi:uncharacterized membrane protein YbhN (UPF0104 family)
MKKTLLIAGPMLLGLAAFVWVLREFDPSAFRAQAAALDWRWIAIAVVFDVLSYLAQGIRWRLLLGNARVNWLSTTRAIYAGLFLNEIVPMRPGEALRGFLMARESGLGLRAIVSSMLAERAIDGILLIAAVLLAGQFIPLPAAVTRVLPWLATAALLLLTFAFLRRQSKWAAMLRNRRALIASSGVLIGQGLAFWAVLRACHLPLSLVAGLAVMLIVRVGTMIPGAPANLGTHQLSAIFGLSLFGISSTLAASTAMILFAVLTIPLWALGLVAFSTAGLNLRTAANLNLQPEPEPNYSQAGL